MAGLRDPFALSHDFTKYETAETWTEVRFPFGSEDSLQSVPQLIAFNVVTGYSNLCERRKTCGLIPLKHEEKSPRVDQLPSHFTIPSRRRTCSNNCGCSESN